MVAGQEATPEDVKNTERLKEYWAHGAGAAKIQWGVPGDWYRCVAEVSKYMDPERAKGFCTNRHIEATGAAPGHAPSEIAAKKVEDKAKKAVGG